MNPPAKNPFASKTIWGALIVVIGLVGRLFGVEVNKDELNGVVDLLNANWTAISDVIGVILVIWGRFTARQPISVAGA